MKQPMTYRGACDASGVVQLDATHFAVGTDESNRIAIYRAGGDGQAERILCLDEFLEAKQSGDGDGEGFAECDIEGATRLENLTLWITSHGRNRKRKKKPERQRLFALEIVSRDGAIDLKPYGVPCKSLLQELLSSKEIPESWNLADAAKKAPQEEGGLNIEAICATQSGGVWIGFRNPIPHGRALLVELLNPISVISGKGTKAQFGRFVTLDLDGRGVRDMIACDGAYLILAGAYDDKRKYALFHWSGGHDHPVLLPLDPSTGGLNPEGILSGKSGVITLFSDDDSAVVNGVTNKDLPDAKRTFRAVTLDLS